MSKTEALIENIYKLDGRVPVAKAIPFGLQHILAIICRKLRRCCIYRRNHSESCTSEEHGGIYD